MTRNGAFADALLELADRLEARDVDFKPQMYRTAAANIRDHPESLDGLVASGRITAIDGVGESIAEKAATFLDRGTFDALERERERLPVDMPALTAVEGLGPKRVKALHDALGIRDLDDLEAAAEAGDIATVSGFGEKTQQNVLDRIEFARQTRKRELLGEARPVAEALLDSLEAVSGVEACETAGSLRRWKETVGDVDLLAATDEPEGAIETFTRLDRVDDVIEAGTTKASIRADGLRVDLRVVDPAEYGAALQYFTGSREHNIRLRGAALEQGYKVNEYGVFDVSDVADPDAGQRVGTRVAGEREAEIYDVLGLPYIEPELREDTGELDAAREGRLPTLLERGHLRGDLHVHTVRSDGRATLDEMAAAAAEAGHDYLVIADHATGPGIVADTGLSEEALRESIAAIQSLNEDTEIELLAGVEANIDPDGAVIDTPDAVLAELDCVVASPHTALDASEDATDRLIAAAEHPSVDILGHPSGRLLNQREGLSIDVAELAAAAAEAGTALEINANPTRLDLWDGAVRSALAEGATLAINTDAHSTREFANLTYGVHVARRGWAEPTDVLNTRSLEELMTFLH
ncbi:MAG: DNA polymerase/3'-5' exonuclease PolX [Halobacteriaceae archaeon]